MSLSREIVYSEEVSRVQKIQFGLLSPERIVKQSVCEITKSYRSNDDIVNNDKYGSLHDPRMGTNDRNILNPISRLNSKYDPGNFGHIELPKPVIPSHFIKFIVKILNMVCFRCSALLINKNDPELMIEIQKRKGKARQKYVDDHANVTACQNCGSVQPIRVGIVKNMVSGIKAKFPHTKDLLLNAENVLKILKLISDEDCDLMGFDHRYSRPDWMVWTCFPVPPLSMRPSIRDETTGKSDDDDLTVKLNDIIKSCEELRTLMGIDKQNPGEKPDIAARINEWWNCLTYHISTYIDNDERAGNTLSGGIPTSKSRNGRHLKTLRARMRSKAGHVRQNLMGKRVDHSARTVITGDPNLSINELGVPIEIADNLAYPETASKYNIGYLNSLLQKGKIKWIVKNVNSSKGYSINSRTINVQFLKNLGNEAHINIEYGDTVWRNLQDGDIVFFNRQPTLHRMGMMAHKAVILPGKSFRLNGSCTSPYAADFDGDEMNMHVPISESCKYELEHLAIVSSQIVSPQASKPVIGLIQDSLLAWFLITRSDAAIPLSVFMDIKGLWSKSHIMHTAKQNDEVSTHDFITPTLPPITMQRSAEKVSASSREEYLTILKRLHRNTGVKVSQEKYDNMSDKEIIEATYELNENMNLVIRNGNYLSGVFDKSLLSKSANGGLIHASWKDCGHLRTQEFIDLMNKIASNWLLYEGFSVGLKDMRIYNEKSIEDIKKVVKEGFDKSEALIEQLFTGDIVPLMEETPRMQFESDISQILRDIRMKVEKITDKYLENDNRLDSMITSGSKGSKANSVSIISLLGQQSVDGLRIQDTIDHRPLPFYERDTVMPSARGFIKNSYYTGLDPVEYLYHAMDGRLGVISTSIKTSTSGYIQRKLVKVMEDLKVFYDGTVRNSHNIVVQPIYGDDGFDGSRIEKNSIGYVKMNNSEFEKNYKLQQDEMQQLLDSSLYEKASQDSELQAMLNEEFETLLKDKDFIINKAKAEQIETPVNYNRLIDDVYYKFGLDKKEKASVSPVDIITKVKYMLEYLVIDDCKQVNEIVHRKFQILTRERLCSKKLLKKKYSKEALEYLIEQTKYLFVVAIINPGELVGAIAAQSIGEPVTQLTLDSFHNTGLATGVSVSGGIPRIKELLEDSKTIATPSVTITLKDKIYLKDSDKFIQEKIQKLIKEKTEEIKDPEALQNALLEINTKTKEELIKKKNFAITNKIASNISETRLVDLIDKDYEITAIYDPSDKNTVIKEDQKMIDEYYEYYKNIFGSDLIQANNDNIIRLVINKYNMLTRKFRATHIKQAIQTAYPSYQVLVSNDNAEKIVLRVRTDMNNTINIRHTINNLKNVIIRGVNNIKNTYTDSKNINNIFTTNSNLLDIFALEEVDQTQTYSNIVHEMYELFGVECARQMLLSEIYNVLDTAKANINNRHLELLCDTMTYQGFIVSVSIHGIKKTESGPIARASFEETVTELTRAAVYNENDNMNGVSANVAFGQYIKAGTNDFGIVLDETMILNNNDDENEEDNEDYTVDFVNAVKDDTYCDNENFDLDFEF